MKTLRILALTSLVAGFGLMTSCDSTSSTSGPSIKDFQIANTDGTGFDEAKDSLTAGGSVATYGEVNADAGLASVTVVVKDAAGATKLSLPNNTSATSYKFGPGTSVSINIATTSTWASGRYSVQLTATDKNGNTATSASLPLLIKGGTTTPAITAATLTLGSNNNSNGGSLDADAMVNYKISEVTTALQGEIDLYYGYSSTAAKDRFFTPAQAKASGFNGISGWNVSSTVALYDLTSAVNEAAFNALTTQAAIDALFTGKVSVISVDASAGTVVGILTSKGAKRVIRVNSITTGAAGSVTIKGYK
jgi:hypothetical protein